MAKFVAAGVTASVAGWAGYCHFTPFTKITRIVDISSRFSVDVGPITLSSYQALDYDGNFYKISCSPLTGHVHPTQVHDKLCKDIIANREEVVIRGYGIRNDLLGLKPNITDVGVSMDPPVETSE